MEDSEIVKSYSNKLKINTNDEFCINNEGSIQSNKNFYWSLTNENNRNKMYRSSSNNLKFLPSISRSSIIESQRQIDQNPLGQIQRSSLGLWENEDIHNLALSLQNK